MTTNQSLWMYFTHAGPVVKTVMLILFAASVISWTYIVQRWLYIKRMRVAVKKFEDKFWSGVDMTKLYSELMVRKDDQLGLGSIFSSAYKEFNRMSKQGDIDQAQMMDTVQRAMRIAHSREMDKLEKHLPFLASVGSTSPYIGLFGTVWGIMTAFHALGSVQQATIAMVAPGISEALIATAMGLFAAIPAVLAYNRYSSQVEGLLNHFDTFQEELINIIQREIKGRFNAVA